MFELRKPYTLRMYRFTAMPMLIKITVTQCRITHHVSSLTGSVNLRLRYRIIKKHIPRSWACGFLLTQAFLPCSLCNVEPSAHRFHLKVFVVRGCTILYNRCRCLWASQRLCTFLLFNIKFYLCYVLLRAKNPRVLHFLTIYSFRSVTHLRQACSHDFFSNRNSWLPTAFSPSPGNRHDASTHFSRR